MVLGPASIRRTLPFAGLSPLRANAGDVPGRILGDDRELTGRPQRAGLFHCDLGSAPACKGLLRDSAALRSSLASGVLDMPGLRDSIHLPVSGAVDRSLPPDVGQIGVRPQIDHKRSGNGGAWGGLAALTRDVHQELL